jgi:uncharacterized protein
MGAQENIAVMQRAYDACNTGDLDTLGEIFDESAVWHLPGKSKYADDYQGSDAILTYFGQLGQETGGTFRAELQGLTADDDGRVVASSTAPGTGTANIWT